MPVLEALGELPVDKEGVPDGVRDLVDVPEGVRDLVTDLLGDGDLEGDGVAV